MYFFYIDESGTKDPEVYAVRRDGTKYTKDHLYVLTAVSLFEYKWRNFEREITNIKLELSDRLVMRFHHVVEYPMFTDSALSNGIQLADLCGYNVYRAFRNEEFTYPYFSKMLEHFYSSDSTPADKLDGLKVWPDDSELFEFARQGWITHRTKQPTLWGAQRGKR